MELLTNNADFHYENRQCRKDREAEERTTQRVGKDGAITSRTAARVCSKTIAGSPRSVSHQPQPTGSRRSSTPSQHASGQAATPRASPRRSSKATSTKEVTTAWTRCYDQPPRRKREPCTRKAIWQCGKFVRDECGSGIVPKRFHFSENRRFWCKTPLTMYQATIGDLAKKILCRENIVPRDVKQGPPCNVCEYILPPCRGYYRKYDCFRSCEEDHVTYRRGNKVYRDRVQRYWQPCLTKEQKSAVDINRYAGQNVYMANRLRHKIDKSIPCW